MITKNVATTRIFQAYDATTGDPATGLSGFTASIVKDAGSLTAFSPTITEIGSGLYRIALSADNTNCNNGAIVITHATAIVNTIIIDPFDPSAVWQASDRTITGQTAGAGIATQLLLESVSLLLNHILALFPVEYNEDLEDYQPVPIPSAATVDFIQTEINRMVGAWPRILTDPPTDELDVLVSLTNLNALEAHGDANWTGGGSGGGATAQQVWEYATRTLSATGITPIKAGLATSANVTDAQAAIINRGNTAWITATIPTDYAKPGDAMTLTSTAVDTIQSGLATSQAVANVQTSINSLSIPTVAEIQNGLAKTTEVNAARDNIKAEGNDNWKTATIPTDYAKPGDAMTLTTGAITTVQSGLATSTQATAIQTTLGTLATSTALSDVAGNVTSVLGKLPATGTVPNTTTAMTLTGDYDNAKTAASAAEVWNNTTRTLTSATGGGATAQEVWEYATRTLTSGSTAPTATENAAAVWAATTRTLTTNFPTVPTVAQITTGVWDAVSRSLTTPFPTVPSSTDNANAVITALGSNDGYTNLLLDVTKMVEQFPDYGTLATVGDVQTTVNTETVNVIQQTVDLTGVEGSLAEITGALPRDVNNRPEILASEKTVEDAQSAIIAHGDANWIGGGGEGGGATPAQIAGAVWNYVNGNGRTISGQNDLATADGLSGVQEAIIVHGDRYWMAGGNEPDPPVADAYASVNDLYLRWGYINVRAWADIDNDRDPDKIMARILWALKSATAAMNKVIERSNYKCPLERVDASYPLVPQTERNICAGLAGEILFKGRQIAATNDSPTIERAVEDFNNWSNDILNGGFIAGVKGKND